MRSVPRGVGGRSRGLARGAGAAAAGAVLIVGLTSASAAPGHPGLPGTPVLPGVRAVLPGPGGQGAGAQPGTPAGASFSRIIIPDLLIVQPSGLTAAQMAGLRGIGGVRSMITFDGAQISVAGRQASVIGVDPARFRSWVPLATGADQRLWTALAAGQFVESSGAAGLPALRRGASYQFTGAAAVRLGYAGPARIGIAGVDLLVNQSVSAKLGLVRQVAALISAPGTSIATLTAQVRRVLGAGARVVDLRDGSLPVFTAKPGQIGNYLQLFQASAARYCPAMSWTVLAAIGQIESADGQNMGPSSAGALGPMQFLPSTWAEWGIDGFGPAGPPDIMNPMDAVPSAARLLCADGAASGTQAGLRTAIFAYNHADWYVSEVLALAARYAAEYP